MDDLERLNSLFEIINEKIDRGITHTDELKRLEKEYQTLKKEINDGTTERNPNTNTKWW